MENKKRIEIKANTVTRVKMTIDNSVIVDAPATYEPIHSPTSPISLPGRECAPLGSEENSTLITPIIRPDMIVDYHYEASSGYLALDNYEIRNLIQPGNLARNNIVWQMGRFGWIMFGFSRGISMASIDVRVFAAEGASVGELMHVLVAENINNNRPVQYTARINGALNTDADPNYAWNPNPASGNNQRPNWLDGNWFYAGSVLGRGAGAPVTPGPMLRNVIPGNRPVKYILLLDSGQDPVPPAPPNPLAHRHGGPEMADFYLESLVEMYRKTYFLLLIDDSSSVGPDNKSKNKYRTTYLNKIKEQLKEWYELEGDFDQKYLGIRIIRWPGDKCEELDSSGKRCKHPSEALAETRDALRGKTVRLLLRGSDTKVSKSVWIDMKKFNSFEQLEANLINSQIKNEIKLDKLHTPLIEALEDVHTCDFESATPSQRIPKLVMTIISDGIHDAKNEFGSPDKILKGDNFKKEYNYLFGVVPTSEIFQCSVGVADNNAYNVLSKIKQISNRIIGKIELHGILDADHWVRKAYACSEFSQHLNTVFAARGARIIPIDHTNTFHSDCILQTVNGQEENVPDSRPRNDTSRRVHVDCAKRIINGKIQGNPAIINIPLPTRPNPPWSGGAETIDTDTDTINSPN